MRFLRGSGAAKPAAPLLAIATILGIGFSTSNCGEVYRPVAQPVLGPQPNPAAAHFVVSVSTNGNNVFVPAVGLCEPSGTSLPCVADHGAASRIDVAGDGVLGIFQTGMNPTHAAVTPNGGRLYIASSGEDLVYSNNTAAPTTLAAKIGLPPPPAGAPTQACPQPALTPCVNFPVFINTTENANAYVANYSGGTVSVINTALNVVTASVPVGLGPVSLAELPNGQAIYTANVGDGTVSVISTTNDTLVATIALGSGAKPVWASARADSSRVYVLDNGGVIYDINTLSNSVLGTTASLGTGANFLFYDQVRNRLYATNPTNSQVAIFDASADPPRLLNLINLSVEAPAVCLGALGGCAPASVGVLGDGSRAYIGSYQLLNCPTASGVFPCVASHLEVIDGPSASLKSVIGTVVVSISATSQNLTSTTYSYSLNSPLALEPGDVIEIGGMTDMVVNGTNYSNNGVFLVNAVGSGTFTVSNPLGFSSNQSGSGVVPISVASTTNTTGCGPVSGPPSALWQPGSARFRVFASASGGGANSPFKVYLSECDAGNVAIVYTYPANGNPADTYVGLSLTAPLSSFPVPSGQVVPPPQNPVFLVAGP